MPVIALFGLYALVTHPVATTAFLIVVGAAMAPSGKRVRHEHHHYHHRR